LVKHRSIQRRLLLILILLFILTLSNCAETIPEVNQITLQSTFSPFPWSFTTKNYHQKLNTSPGATWTLDYQAVIDLQKHETKFGPFTEIIVAIAGYLKHDKEGFWHVGPGTYALSSNFTVTGLPIERFVDWPRLRLLHGRDGSPFEAIERFPLSPDSDYTKIQHLSGKLTVNIPDEIPEGYYELRVMIFVKVNGVEDPILLENFSTSPNSQNEQVLPLLKIGNPDTPRIPWTILARQFYRGQAGTLPNEEHGRVGICSRSGFPTQLILPPDQYIIEPSLPSLFPQSSLPPVDGGGDVPPMRLNHHLRFENGQIRCSLSGPAGFIDLGTSEIIGKKGIDLQLKNGGFRADLRTTGTYEIKLSGHMYDRYDRPFNGGGTYLVHIALPLSFSTSCKPGSNFIVGDTYPPKVNINPPFPADVTVTVEYFPNSDPNRKKSWVARGKANSFGHFSPHVPSLLEFDEPGEYKSRIVAQYLDNQGNLWMGEQVSAGVIAPNQSIIALHGTRSFPYNLKIEEKHFGGMKRFKDRLEQSLSFFPVKPVLLPDPFPPYNYHDTLFIPANGFNESLIGTMMSMQVKEEALSKRLLEEYTLTSLLPPPIHQLGKNRWSYLQNVLQVAVDSPGWFPANIQNSDELPILPISNDQHHSFAFPANNWLDAYLYLGVVRPGFPVLTAVKQSDAIGLYWRASPNRFGFHFNAGANGDLPGDVYRLQAGVVLLDRESGRNLYDAYGASIAAVSSDGTPTSILPPGVQPLLTFGGRKHWIFLGTDTHDALEQGESIALGGMIFPTVEANVTWQVTTPSGESIEVKAQANRLGIVRGQPLIKAVEAGIYKIKVNVDYNGIQGDIVGSSDGTYWHCVLPSDHRNLMKINLPAISWVDPIQGIDLRVTWPEHLEKIKIHYGVIMPGQVLDQDSLEDLENHWGYRFTPVQFASQFSNLDVRNFGSGNWEMADTVVFQVFLEAKDGNQKVYDSLRLILRKNTLYNYEQLMPSNDNNTHTATTHPHAMHHPFPSN